MIRVTIIGSGNVAEALAIALSGCDGEVLQLVEVAGRNEERLVQISQITGCRTSNIENLAEADIYILSVSDDTIENLAHSLIRPAESLLVHTAGSVPMGELDGVIYPMQSFTKGRRVNFREVPLFIEGDSPVIAAVANAISSNVIEMSSERRKTLHLAAVFACNFTNAMLTATHEILSQEDIPYDLYRPLVEETISKAFTSTPHEAQTGAARRGDMKIQSRHVEMLRHDENLTQIYKIISKYIWETSKKI
ncbi:MAG: Rossmann-like and DUF2520 domain-containing protein [Rikenellaceae bacterium]